MSCVSLTKFINNKLLHVDKQLWFDQLQDVGDNMTEEEKDGCKKTRVKQFFFKDRFYKYIYELANTFYINLQKHENLVPKLPKNKSDTVKRVCEYILLNCNKFSIGDVHNHPEGAAFLELCGSSKLSAKNDSIYILSQQDLLSHFYQFWVPNERDYMKPTPDDKLRLMGILLSDQVRDYLPDIMGISSGGNRQQLDASRGRQALGWNLTLDLYIDLNHTVHLPERWCLEETRNEINAELGDDGYDKYGKFNPNRQDRISLPWTLPLLKTMFGMVRKSYNRVMERYTMGTGGGPGMPENYVIWQERDETTFTGYISQVTADLYLTIVHMWDRMYDYPFVTTREQIPQEARIDDRESEQLSDGNVSSTGSKSDSTQKKNLFKEDIRAISTAIEHFQRQREIANKKVINEIVSSFSMTNGQDKTDEMFDSDQRQKLVEKIHSTNNTINVFKKEVEELKKKRKKALKMSKPKKAIKYSSEAAEKEGIIESLGLALSRHAEELKTISSSGVGYAQNQSLSAYNSNRTDDNCDESSVELEVGE